MSRKHGYVKYRLEGCRCDTCRNDCKLQMRRYRRSKAYGKVYLVDAGPVRAHVQALQREGLGAERIARLAGVGLGTMNGLLYGFGGKPPSRKIHPEPAKKILAVSATIDTLSSRAAMDGTGTRRRLQALAAIGWSMSAVARAWGKSPPCVIPLFTAERVRVGTARAVRELYDALSSAPPPYHSGSRHQKAAITRTKRMAAERGWRPPAAWDDDTIDDPTFVPCVEDDPGLVDEVAIERAIKTKSAKDLTTAERRALVLLLHERGMPVSVAARILKCGPGRIAAILGEVA